MIALSLTPLMFKVNEDGTLAHLGPWPERALIAEDLLARADGVRLVAGDGLLTFRCTNGGARYALSASTDPRLLQGRLVESW